MVDVPRELVGEVDPADVEQLARAADDDGWTCAACGGAGEVDGAARVVLLREGPVTVARLAHPRCAPASVRHVSGLGESLAEPRPATAVAGLAGDVPLLVVDLADTVAGGDPGSDRVDRVAAHLLGLGLGLVADLRGLHALPAAAGWRATLGPDRLTVMQPDETSLYDGELVLPDGWAAASTVGGCVLLVGSGLGAHAAPDRLGGRLAAAAGAGRLVGAVVAVT